MVTALSFRSFWSTSANDERNDFEALYPARNEPGIVEAIARGGLFSVVVVPPEASPAATGDATTGSFRGARVGNL